MPFNLLLLPLLGGYIFVRFFNRTSITILRSDKDRLLIRASIAGLCLLIVAYSITSVVQFLFPCDTETGCLYTWWKRNVPFEYAGTSLTAFFLGALGWWPLNLIFSREKAIDWAIEEDADPLEEALKESADDEQPLAITLTTGKVYVGIVTHQFNPATPTNNIAIFPLQSGFRVKETQELHLTTNYAVVAQDLGQQLDVIADAIWKADAILKKVQNKQVKKAADHTRIEKLENRVDELLADWQEIEARINLFEVVIPVNQIASVFFFDEIIFEHYFTGPLEPPDSISAIDSK